MDTLLHFVCHNPDCVYFNQVRTVRMTHLGQGLYTRPPVVCECNPTVEVRYATTTPEGWIFDEASLTPDWATSPTLVPAVPEPMEPPC